nr:MAG TPA: hypothetical protein [Caudoviricetes sp.]
MVNKFPLNPSPSYITTTPTTLISFKLSNKRSSYALFKDTKRRWPFFVIKKVTI